MSTSLETKYLGLQLAHPYMVAASSLTASVEGIRKAWEHGASAIVLKSLFEEQVQHDTQVPAAEGDEYPHPEALDYIQQMGMRIGPKDYLDLLRGARKEVQVPLIASVNCVGTSWWSEYARQLTDAGADALEVNIGFLGNDPTEDSRAVESRLYRIVEKVRAATTLPLAVKLGANWSSLPHVLAEVYRLGAQGVVLFNRFYQMDMSLESMTLKPGVAFSQSTDYTQSLRWMSLLHGKTSLDLSASGGVHDAPAGLKLLAAGASTVQLCSVLYKQGYKALGTMVEDTRSWLERHGHADLSTFRGSMAQKKSQDPAAYERVQYIKALTGMY